MVLFPNRSRAGSPMIHLISVMFHAIRFHQPAVACPRHFAFFLRRFGGDLSGQRRVGRKGRSFSRFDGGACLLLKEFGVDAFLTQAASSGNHDAQRF
jgi:hypothetical protein